MKYLITTLLMFGCMPDYQGYIKSEDVNKIQIENKTQNRLIPDKITVSDLFSIKRIVLGINSMQPIKDSSIKLRNQFGDYEMKVELKDNSIKRFDIIYTVYNGVIIAECNSLWQPYDNLYKNDKLEWVILALFQPK